MHYLRNNILAFIIFFYGYSSSSYKTVVDKDGVIQIIATPDHFLPYCEKVIKDDGTVAFGFMILFLDEQRRGYVK